MFVCKECGSDEVRESAMVDCNTREVIRLTSLRGDDFWCDKCDCEVETIWKEEPEECICRQCLLYGFHCNHKYHKKPCSMAYAQFQVVKP